MSKHTKGPLKVAVSDKWPFDIVTTAEDGSVRFVTRLPCFSTEDRNAKDAVECRSFKPSEREEYAAINRQTIADEVLRAAAPELLQALKQMIAWEDGERTEIDAMANARAIVKKAEGEQQ